MVWSNWRVRAAKFMALIGVSLAFSAPAHAIYILVEGEGPVVGISGFGGAQPTGTVKTGDEFRFFFGVDPAAAPLVFNGGPSRQVFAADIIGITISLADYHFAYNGTSN